MVVKPACVCVCCVLLQYMVQSDSSGVYCDSSSSAMLLQSSCGSDVVSYEMTPQFDLS